MSKNEETASAVARDEQRNRFVYDFLYYDKQRVGSFLAQFIDAGHLQQVRESEHASKGTKRGLKIGVGASYLGTGGNVNFDHSPGEQGSEGIERIYDPLWSNPLELLAYLNEAGLICRDVTAARIGQFVLATGSLSVLNPTTMTKIWESPQLKKAFAAAEITKAKALLNADPQIAALHNKQKAEAEKAIIAMAEANALATLEVVSTFPHSAQCTITGTNFALWSSLASESMIGAVTDLALKHGTEVAGTWSLLGILDALPGPIPPQKVLPNTTELQHFDPWIGNFANLARTVLGRPPNSYGATTLLIFREIAEGE